MRRGYPELVFKRYEKPGDIDESTLTRLIEWPDKLESFERSLIKNTTAWPRVLVREQGEVIGIAMLKASERFTYLQPDGKRALANISTAITLDRSHVRALMPVPNEVQRLMLAWSLCLLLDIFERNGLLFIDLSARNLLWTLDPRPEVFLLDCDSIFFQDRLGSARPVRTTNWFDPWFEDPPSSKEMRGLFALIFTRLIFTDKKYPNIKSPLILPPEHICAKYFQDLVTAGYSKNLSSRPSLDMWRRRIEKVFQQEKKVYFRSAVPVLSEAESKSQESFLKRFGKAYIKELSHPLRSCLAKIF